VLENLRQFIESAYCKTRSEIYHEKGDLFTRLKFARVGADADEQENVLLILHQILDGDENALDRLIEQIDYVIQPKSIRSVSPDNDDPIFTNADWSNHHEIERYNYFIDCPVEIHVLSTLELRLLSPSLSSCEKLGWFVASDSVNIFIPQ